jgi:hypothetical protein
MSGYPFEDRCHPRRSLSFGIMPGAVSTLRMFWWLGWFKSQGKGYQTRINTILRRYYETHRKAS